MKKWYEIPEDEIAMVDFNEVKCFYALNKWVDDMKESIIKELKKGSWVHLGSSATGHEAAAMVECDGLNWLWDLCGDNLKLGRFALGLCVTLSH